MRRRQRKPDLALHAIYVCCLINSPIPTWVATAFVERYRRGYWGEIKSWDEVFGRPPTRHGTRKRIERDMTAQQLVVEEIRRLQAENKPLNEEEFSAIGRRLGVGGKTRVKELLRDARFWEHYSAERLLGVLGPQKSP